jgi:hypothetical protein
MWWNKWFKRSPRQPATRRRSLRLGLEQLEDRAVPSNFTAANVADLIADINQANLLGGANTITLAAGARFTLTAANTPGVGGDWIANGLPVVAAGDDLVILGNGDTIERGVSTEGFRLVKVAAGAFLTLTDLTLQGGVASLSGPGQPAAGGAIYSQGALTLDGVTVQNNTALGDAAQGGGIWSNGTLTLKGNSLIQNNQAIGIDAASSPYDVEAGSASGGGVYVAGGTATLTNVTLSGNTAQGGNGTAVQVYDGKGSGTYHWYVAPGGSGYGGGLYVADGTVELHGTSVTGNSALGGAGARHDKLRSSPGSGIGGGVFIDPAALVCLDAFTQSHVRHNTASTADRDIHGPWSPC